MSEKNESVLVGSDNLPNDARTLLSDMMAQLMETYEFKHGSTAAYWHLAAVLSQHLGEGKQ